MFPTPLRRFPYFAFGAGLRPCASFGLAHALFNLVEWSTACWPLRPKQARITLNLKLIGKMTLHAAPGARQKRDAGKMLEEVSLCYKKAASTCLVFHLSPSPSHLSPRDHSPALSFDFFAIHLRFCRSCRNGQVFEPRVLDCVVLNQHPPIDRYRGASGRPAAARRCRTLLPAVPLLQFDKELCEGELPSEYRGVLNASDVCAAGDLLDGDAVLVFLQNSLKPPGITTTPLKRAVKAINRLRNHRQLLKRLSEEPGLPRDPNQREDTANLPRRIPNPRARKDPYEAYSKGRRGRSTR